MTGTSLIVSWQYWYIWCSCFRRRLFLFSDEVLPLHWLCYCFHFLRFVAVVLRVPSLIMTLAFKTEKNEISKKSQYNNDCQSSKGLSNSYSWNACILNILDPVGNVHICGAVSQLQALELCCPNNVPCILWVPPVVSHD